MVDLTISLVSTVEMAESIKLFQFLQKFHQIIGIYPHQSNQKQRSTNWTKIVFLISFTEFLFTTIAFLLFEAKSMFDYGLVFYLLVSLINDSATYLILIWQSKNTLKFIENCVGFIEKSECGINVSMEMYH